MDKRSECKYGAECYQKNPAHHKKYKHPPKRNHEETLADENQETKKHKPSDPESESSFNETLDDHSLNESKISEEENQKDDNDIKTKEEEEEKEDSIKEEEEENKSISEEIIDIQDTDLEKCKHFIKSKFLVEMPDDFFSFWEFCKTISKNKPKDAFDSVGLHLVGPFDVLAGNFNGKERFTPEQYLCHWRYYYDPPEFQTILRGDNKTEQHFGYFRDNPDETPCFVAENHSAKDCIIKPIGPNIFSAVNVILNEILKKADPFKKMAITRLHRQLLAWAAENKIPMEDTSSAMTTRNRRIVARTFHRAGIVVPVDKKNDLGYRPLMETESKLKALLTNIKEATVPAERSAHFNELQPLITATNIAIDECDFGTGLELGMDFFTFGCEHLHQVALQFLKNAYTFLQRDAFASIIAAHLKNRKKGFKQSILY